MIRRWRPEDERRLAALLAARNREYDAKAAPNLGFCGLSYRQLASALILLKLGPEHATRAEAHLTTDPVIAWACRVADTLPD